MKNIIAVLVLMCLIISCKQRNEPKKSTTNINKQHKSLLWKRQIPLDMANYPKNIDTLYSQKTILQEKLDGLIYATAYFQADPCGQRIPDIEVKGDSIFLRVRFEGKEVCTEFLLRKVEYLIDNPSNKDYKLKIKLEGEK
ncbi:MAG: hypothetical protein ACO1N9_08190 [Flavobacterium sp.]